MRALLSYAAAAALVIGGLYLLDVFTWTGLAYTVGIGDGATLRWPWGTRLLWIELVHQGAVAVVMALMWREAKLEVPTMRDLWLAAHVSAAQRVARRATWTWGGIKAGIDQHKAHPVVSTSTTASTRVPTDTAAETTTSKAA